MSLVTFGLFHLGFQLVEQIVKALEVGLPDFAVVLQPLTGLGEPLAVNAAQVGASNNAAAHEFGMSTTRTCLEAAGKDIRSGVASSVRLRSPSARLRKIVRLAGCANA